MHIEKICVFQYDYDTENPSQFYEENPRVYIDDKI